MKVTDKTYTGFKVTVRATGYKTISPGNAQYIAAKKDDGSDERIGWQTPPESTEYFDEEVYEQRVDTLSIVDVIAAVNRKP